MALFPSTSIASAAGGYDINYSCRFQEVNKSYLHQTFSSAGNRKTWTVSFWFKRSNITHSAHQYIFSADNNGEIFIRGTGDDLAFQHIGASSQWIGPSPRKYRDTSAWYHLILAVDTSQATADDRAKLYLNGERITTAELNSGVWGTGSLPALNAENDVNNNVVHSIGWKTIVNQTSFDGYMAEHIFVDGTQYGPEAFGEVDSDYGHWKPIEFEGTFGSNGWHLDFADASALGNDISGNNHDFTLSNISSHDQMTDTPTNNFSVFNPLDNYYGGHTYAEGNLKVTTGLPSYARVNGTIGVTSGKWYFEMYQVTKAQYNNDGGNYISVGISEREATAGGTDANQHPGASSDSYGYYSTDGSKLNNAPGGVGRVSYGASYTVGDIVGVAFDLDNHKIYFSKNGTWQDSGDPTSGATGTGAAFSLGTGRTYRPSFSDISGNATGPAGVCVFNFGQDGTFAGAKTAQGNSDSEDIGNFYYAVPSGFKALCSKNLPTPAVKPKEHFNPVLWTGNGTGTTRAITGVGFSPDMVWMKKRSTGTEHHRLYDRIRTTTGGYSALFPSHTYYDAEYDSYGIVQSFDADGVTFKDGASGGTANNSGHTYVGWSWKANGSGSANTDGSIYTTSTSANTAAGFSISTYTGNGTGGATVGHGLSKAPELVIIKNRSDISPHTGSWVVGSIQSLGSMDFTDYMTLNSNGAVADEAALFHDTAPTSSVVTISTGNWVNINTKNYVMYCWHSVDGFSKIGAYAGNGNADGTFIYTGFRPKFVITKPIQAASNWHMYDTVRSPYNVVDKKLSANLSNIEAGPEADIDILSNGFKTRRVTSALSNSGEGYLFIAFAEHPFKYTTAR